MCDADIEELSLPAVWTLKVKMLSICPEASVCPEKMAMRPLKSPDRFDQSAYATQRVCEEPCLRPRLVRLRLAERPWLAGALGVCSHCDEKVGLFS